MYALLAKLLLLLWLLFLKHYANHVYAAEPNVVELLNCMPLVALRYDLVDEFCQFPASSRQLPRPRPLLHLHPPLPPIIPNVQYHFSRVLNSRRHCISVFTVVLHAVVCQCDTFHSCSFFVPCSGFWLLLP